MKMNRLEQYINEVLLREDPYLVGQEYPNQPWTPLKLLKNPIRRSLCLNEIVFDIDAKNWAKCYKLAYNLEKVLNKLNIPFLRFTSGRYLHYHVFFDKKIETPDEIWRDYFKNQVNADKITIEQLREFLRKIKIGLFEFIISKVKKVKGTDFDRNIMRAERHLIRMEGSMNEKTGYYKSLLFELPTEQPKITADKVVLPERFEYWNIPEELLYFVYEKYVKNDKSILLSTPLITRKEIKTENKSEASEDINRNITINWIENVLNNPTFTDGRKRLIDLVIVPYLVNIKGLNEEEAIRITYEWALKCHKLAPITKNNNRPMSEYDLLKYVTYKVKYAKRKGLKPLKKENLANWFGDCIEMLSKV